jgi:hypothetical protein
VPAAAVGFFVVAVVGSPGSCVSDDRPIEVTLENAAAFLAKWDALEAELDAGRPASRVFTESEATSRARAWVEEEDVPVDDLYLCFDDDGGRASGSVDVPFSPGNIEVLVHGTMLFTGEQPEADIENIEVGGLPGELTDLAENFITGLVDDQTNGVVLEHDYVLTFVEGEMTVSGTP